MLPFSDLDGSARMRSVDIVLSKDDFVPGDRIDGMVVCKCDKSFNCNRVTLVLHGEEMSRVVHGAGKNTRVHMETREHVHQELELLGPCQVQEGDNSYEFSVVLPPDLPGSFSGYYSHVEYSIKANFEISWAYDEWSKKVLNVEFIPQYLISIEERKSAEHDGVPSISIEVGNDLLRPGQTFSLRFMIPGNPKFRGVRVQLLTRESVAPHGNSAEYDTTLAEVYHPKEEIAEETWTETVLEVPTRCPPPFKTDLIELTYWLKVTLDIPWRIDESLFMPLRFSIEGHEADVDTIH